MTNACTLTRQKEQVDKGEQKHHLNVSRYLLDPFVKIPLALLYIINRNTFTTNTQGPKALIILSIIMSIDPAQDIFRMLTWQFKATENGCPRCH